MDGEPVTKRRRTTPPVSQGEPATVAGEPTADANLAQQQDVPDEDHAAPPSTAAGAHAKPLSALFQAKTPSPKKKKRTVDLRQSGRIGDDDKENFTALLARLNKESELHISLRRTHCCGPNEAADSGGSPFAPRRPGRRLLPLLSFDVLTLCLTQLRRKRQRSGAGQMRQS
jgi:hypothetical protein